MVHTANFRFQDERWNSDSDFWFKCTLLLNWMFHWHKKLNVVFSTDWMLSSTRLHLKTKSHKNALLPQVCMDIGYESHLFTVSYLTLIPIALSYLLRLTDHQSPATDDGRIHFKLCSGAGRPYERSHGGGRRHAAWPCSWTCGRCCRRETWLDTR